MGIRGSFLVTMFLASRRIVSSRLRGFKRSPGTFWQCLPTGASAKQLDVVELSSLATLKSRGRSWMFQNEKPGEGHRASKIVSERRGKGLVRGTPGGMSLRRARTEPSCINKVPQRKLGTEKRKPRRPCRGFPCRYTFPRLFARISLLTKVVQRGETRATRWHEVQFN